VTLEITDEALQAKNDKVRSRLAFLQGWVGRWESVRRLGQRLVVCKAGSKVWWFARLGQECGVVVCKAGVRVR
jgi:hypothetical protein